MVWAGRSLKADPVPVPCCGQKYLLLHQVVLSGLAPTFPHSSYAGGHRAGSRTAGIAMFIILYSLLLKYRMDHILFFPALGIPRETLSPVLTLSKGSAPALHHLRCYRESCSREKVHGWSHYGAYCMKLRLLVVCSVFLGVWSRF